MPGTDNDEIAFQTMDGTRHTPDSLREMSNEKKKAVSREIEELLGLLSEATSSDYTAQIKRVREQMFDHSDAVAINTLISAERIARDVYIKKNPKKKSLRPEAVFIVTRLDKALVAGTMFTFRDATDRILIHGENFTGVALEVIMGDLASDGFE